MDKTQFLESLAKNVDDFEAAAALGLDPNVPSCPAWTAGQLVIHLGDVFDFWSRIVGQALPDEASVSALEATLSKEREARTRSEFYSSHRALEYFKGCAENIQTALASADPDQGNWTWYPPNQTAGFVQRRMAHESLIHRWDIQRAHGMQLSLEPLEVAADGIDEILTNELVGWPEERMEKTGSYHLHCSDTPGEWLVKSTGAEIVVTRDHARADVAITGTASDLDLFLWSRISADQLTLHGDTHRATELNGLLETE